MHPKLRKEAGHPEWKQPLPPAQSEGLANLGAHFSVFQTGIRPARALPVPTRPPNSRRYTVTAGCSLLLEGGGMCCLSVMVKG